MLISEGIQNQITDLENQLQTARQQRTELTVNIQQTQNRFTVCVELVKQDTLISPIFVVIVVIVVWLSSYSHRCAELQADMDDHENSRDRRMKQAKQQLSENKKQVKTLQKVSFVSD